MKYLLILIAGAILTSCYRFPEEGECSVVPATNNPSITKEKSSGFMPGVKI
jgi:hypothetical protein